MVNGTGVAREEERDGMEEGWKKEDGRKEGGWMQGRKEDGWKEGGGGRKGVGEAERISTLIQEVDQDPGQQSGWRETQVSGTPRFGYSTSAAVYGLMVGVHLLTLLGIFV